MFAWRERLHGVGDRTLKRSRDRECLESALRARATWAPLLAPLRAHTPPGARAYAWERGCAGAAHAADRALAIINLDRFGGAQRIELGGVLVRFQRQKRTFSH